MLRIELLPGILILLIALAKLAAELVTFRYDWDIDHMMYFGGRLLAGELHWTVEFDDKLPVVQALFVLPAKVHSIRVWQIMSALGIFAGCVSAYIFLVAAIRDYFPEVRTRAAKTVAFYCAVLIGCSFALLPGGITQINPMAASLAIMSIAFADAARREFTNSRTRCYSAYLLGAFSASVAIGIRPYFLYPLVLAGVWTALKVDWRVAEIGQLPPTTNRRLTAAQVSFWGICWIMCIGFFGLAVNAFPYLVVGRLDVLLAGLEMLSQELIPQDIGWILKKQLSTLLITPELFVLVFALWGVTIISLPLLVRRTESWRSNYHAALDIGYLVILCPLLLEIAILTRHFWPHYIQMFVPFLGIGVGLLGANLVAKGGLHFSRVQTRWLVIAGLIVISVSSKEEIAASLGAISKLYSQRHSQAEQLATFKSFLATRPASERDFLNPSRMYFHWQLDEPRHGFPHASNTEHIVKRGWWQSVEVPEPFELPTNRDAYCTMLKAKGPSLVVELGKSDVSECFLEKADSKYSRVYEKTEPFARDLVIFERIP